MAANHLSVIMVRSLRVRLGTVFAGKPVTREQPLILWDALRSSLS